MRHLYNLQKWKVLKLPGSELTWPEDAAEQADDDEWVEDGCDQDDAQHEESQDEGVGEDDGDAYADEDEDAYEAWNA